MPANYRPACITAGCTNRASYGSRTGECNDCKMRTCKICGVRFKPIVSSKPDLCPTCNQNHRVRTRFTAANLLDVFGDESGKIQPGILKREQHHE